MSATGLMLILVPASLTVAANLLLRSGTERPSVAWPLLSAA